MSVRKSILSALRTDLAKITTANGYTTNIQEVHTGLPYFEDVKSFPSIAIARLNERNEKLSDGLVRHTSYYGVVVYLHSELSTGSTNNFEVDSEDAYDDVLDLFETYTTTEAIDGVESIEITGCETYPDEDGKGFIYIPVTITYY